MTKHSTATAQIILCPNFHMRKWWLRKVFRVYVVLLWLMREFWGLAAWFKLPNLLIIWLWTHFLTSLSIIFFIHNMGNNNNNVYMHVKSLQSYLTLCYPRDHRLPSSCDHGILQARILEWVAMPSWWSFQPRDQTHISYVPRQGGSLPLVPHGKPINNVYRSGLFIYSF